MKKTLRRSSNLPCFRLKRLAALSLTALALSACGPAPVGFADDIIVTSGTQDSAYTGENSLVKNAESTETPGIYVLNLANSYTGTTTINGGTIQLSGSGTLGTGDLIINDGGTLESQKQISAKLLPANVYVYSGGALFSNYKDAFGYSGALINNVYLYGGKYLLGAGENETAGGFNFYLKGGSIENATGTSKPMDTLDSKVKFFAQSETGATAEAPTVSTISIPLRLRNDAWSGLLAVDVEANAQLNLTGRLFYFTSNTNTIGIEKNGSGTLVVSNKDNSFSGATQINGGTLRVENNSLAGTSGITVADGATLELGTSGAIAKPVSVVGTGVSGAGAIHFTADGTISSAVTLTGATTVGVDSGFTGKLTGGVSGAYTLTKTGDGSFVLGGAQAQTETIISAGNLTFDGAGSLSGKLSFNSAGTITKTGAGTFSLADATDISSIYDNAITVSAGTLVFDVNTVNNILTGALTVDSGACLGVKNSGTEAVTLAFPANSTINGGIEKTGSGTVILPTSSSISTIISSGGTLQLGTDAASFGASSAVLQASENATIEYYVNTGDTSAFTGTMTGDGTVVKKGAGILTMTKSTTNKDFTTDLTIDAGTVKLLGSGEVNQFSGSTVTINDGATLDLANHDSLGYNNSATNQTYDIIINKGGTMVNSSGNDSIRYCNIKLVGGALAATTGQYDILTDTAKILGLAAADATADNPTISTVSGKYNLRETMAAGTSFNIDVADKAQIDFTGYISESAGYGLIKSGVGALVLSNTGNSFSGATQITGGTLRVENNSLAGTSGITVADGATLELGASGAIAKTVSVVGTGVSGAGAIHFAADGTISSAVTLTGATTVGVDSEFTGKLTGGMSGDFALTKTGDGTLSLTGTQAQTETIISAGNLVFDGVGSVTGKVTFNSSGTIAKTGAGTFSLVDMAPTSSLLTKAIAVDGGTLLLGPETAAALTGTVTVAAGALLEINNPTTDAITVSAAVSGAGTLNKTGMGTVVLPGAAALTVTNIKSSEGTLQLGTDAASFGASSAVLQTSENATIDYYVKSGDSSAFTGSLTGSGTVVKEGAGTLVINKGAGIAGNLTINEGKVSVLSTLSLNSGKNVKLTVNPGATLSCDIKDALGYSGSYTINLNGGTLLNTADNETLGTVTFNMTGGTIKTTADAFHVLRQATVFNVLAASGATADNPTVSTISANMCLRDDQWHNNQIEFNIEQNAELDLTGSILKYNSVTDKPTGFKKTGAGTMVVSNTGTNIYGDVIVTAGTLLVKNDALKSVNKVSVAQGAILDMDKTVDFKNLDLFGIQDVELSLDSEGAPTATGSIVSGALNVGNGASFHLGTLSETPLYWMDFVHADMSLLTTGITDVSTLPQTVSVTMDPDLFGADTFEVRAMATLVNPGAGETPYYQLTIGVPEPSTWALLVLGVFGLAFFRKIDVAIHGNEKP